MSRSTFDRIVTSEPVNSVAARVVDERGGSENGDRHAFDTGDEIPDAVIPTQAPTPDFASTAPTPDFASTAPTPDFASTVKLMAKYVEICAHEERCPLEFPEANEVLFTRSAVVFMAGSYERLHLDMCVKCRAVFVPLDKPPSIA